MLLDAFLAPPIVKLRIAIAKTVKESISAVNLMGLHLTDGPDWHLFRFIGLCEQVGGVVDEENAAGQVRRPVLRSLMQALILGDKKIYGAPLKWLCLESGGNYSMASPSGLLFGFVMLRGQGFR